MRQPDNVHRHRASWSECHGLLRWAVTGAAGGLVSIGLIGCRDLAGTQPLPPGTANPAFYSTPTGAVGLRHQAVYDLQQLLPRHVIATGLLSDELQSNTIGASAGYHIIGVANASDFADARLLPDESYNSSGGGGNSLTGQDYTALQHVRADISQALGAIAAYDTGAKAIGDPRVLRAELFALQGYTELLLADFYCSGVPLSTVDFQRDYTYHAGSTTAQVYQDALVQEDSALALADTSTQTQYLARVLKGRALVALDQVPAAAQVVASVPDGFQYQLAVNFRTFGNTDDPLVNQLNDDDGATVADTEGRNGLPYLSSGDPRTAVMITYPVHTFGTDGTNSVPLTFPSKYSTSGFRPFVVASGVEARLIQAEAALRAGNSGSWLATLNALRTDGNGVTIPADTAPADTILDTLGVTGCGGANGTCGSGPGGNTPSFGQPSSGFPPAGYSVVAADTVSPAPAGIQDYCNSNSWYNPCWQGDTMVVLHYVRPQQITPEHTVWNPGTGGVGGLPLLTDPGTDSARVALLFQERAYWLFLTGERQGDLRRLLRQYGSVGFRRQDQVYPTGLFTGLGTSVYGTDVTAAIPGTEYLNHLYHGCLDRNP